jgi:hypothetical protein
MAKFKPARGRKQVPAQRANAVGCIIVLVLVFLLLFLVMYYTIAQ